MAFEHDVWLTINISLAYVLLFLPLQTVGQGSCAQAPTSAAQIVCEQLHRWDTNARSAPKVATLPKLPPAIPGQPAPLVGAELAAIPTTPYQCMDLNCLSGYLGGRAVSKARRKEYRTLSDDERQRYHAAFLSLKRSGEYDNLARLHSQFASSGGAHSGPSFLPWHREFIKRVEIAIRLIDPSLALPYWDSTLDGALPTPTDSIMFSDAFMGINDASGNVITGPFRGWRTLSGRPNILRRIGAQGALFSEANINFVANANSINQVLAYTAPRQGCPFQIDWNVLEYTHGNVHIWIGGDMTDQSTSSNDPIFFLHHSFVDYIWEMYRQNRQDRFSRETTYPQDQPLCSSSFHFNSAYMTPFEPWRNNDGLNNMYTDNMYEYDPRPSCPACSGSPYLFCDQSRGRCIAKVRTGGNCQSLVGDSCYNGHCVGGRCVGGPAPTTASPPVPIQRPSVVIQNCYNEHECCSIWASQRQCNSNPGYMNEWCKPSCGRCQPECNDRHPKCSEWARMGECTKNVYWMAENCRQSCGKCSVTRAAFCRGGGGGRAQPATTARPLQGCFNENICCQYWKLQGQCAANSEWMYCNCRVSCGICTPNFVFGNCLDYHPSCRQWAASGECQKNRNWMSENCRTSCRICLNMNQLSARCKSGRRLGRSIFEAYIKSDLYTNKGIYINYLNEKIRA